MQGSLVGGVLVGEGCGVVDESGGMMRGVERVIAEHAGRAGSAEAWGGMWREVVELLVNSRASFGLFKRALELAGGDWASSNGPVPAWVPTRESAAGTNIGRFMGERGFSEYEELHKWSVRCRGEFWEGVIQKLGVVFKTPPQSIIGAAGDAARPDWLSGAMLNIADSCLGADPGKTAILCQDEGGPLRRMTYGELEKLVNRVANGLVEQGFSAGDAIAVDMAMSAEAVAIYLGIIRAGCCVVSIADSFAAEEIATRLHLGGAQAVFTVDYYVRRGKRVEIYPKVKRAGAVRAIVLTCREDEAGAVDLREGDMLWGDFLSGEECFDSVGCLPGDHTNILFSSGTTGVPKAIPWTHTTPIKCAMDGLFHHNITEDSVLAWPSNLGWMMGPFVIYASLMNRASMALYTGAPLGSDFGEFVARAGVTMLGVVPSLVKVWRESACMEGLDWSRIRSFGSTGECSNAEDMLYLMYLAGNKPVIEYCGGTEIGGGFITGTLVQPASPAAFSTPALGMDFVLLDEEGRPTDDGEVFLIPPSIGLSEELLNRDHDEVYYQGCPAGPEGEVLRRHGDQFARLGGGYFRAHGRVDDTMNLGGIKVSAAEIERVLMSIPQIRECAAVAAQPTGGGPSRLVIYAVIAESVAADRPILLQETQAKLARDLNPLFRVSDVVIVKSLPRTASNKVLHRQLRDDYASRVQSSSQV